MFNSRKSKKSRAHIYICIHINKKVLEKREQELAKFHKSPRYVGSKKRILYTPTAHRSTSRSLCFVPSSSLFESAKEREKKVRIQRANVVINTFSLRIVCVV